MNSRRSLVVSALCLGTMGSTAMGQWVTAGANIYYTAGNVGIGTANPAWPLDVRAAVDRGISVTNTKDTGSTYGIFSVARSPSARGVYGLANNVDGTGYGVLGVSNGSTGHGVRGVAQSTAANKASYGVSGKSESAKGAGVFGESTNGIGVIGQSNSTANGVNNGSTSIAGVRGIVSSINAGSFSAGVWGINNSTSVKGIGVAGYQAGSGYGLFGKVASANGYAGYFEGGRNYFQGRTGFGHSSPTAQVDVAGDMRIRTGDRFYFGEDTENDDPTYFERAYNGEDNTILRLVIGDDPSGAQLDWFIIATRSLAGGSEQNKIWLGSDGSAYKPGGGVWSATSDRRVKRDITPLEGSLDRMLELHGVSFEYIDPTLPGAAEGLQRGFVAQEVESVFPEWVGELNGLKTLSVRGFEALTVEALRDLRDEKDRQIAELRSENDALRARLEKIEAMLEAGR